MSLRTEQITEKRKQGISKRDNDSNKWLKNQTNRKIRRTKIDNEINLKKYKGWVY